MRRRLRQLRVDQRGAVAVMVGLLMVVLLGSAALVLDLARLRHERHMLQAAVDLGSLAGASFLPVNSSSTASAAESMARSIAVKNDPALDRRVVIDWVLVRAREPGPAAAERKGSWGGGIQRGDKAFHLCNPYARLCHSIRERLGDGPVMVRHPSSGSNRGTRKPAGHRLPRHCGQISCRSTRVRDDGRAECPRRRRQRQGRDRRPKCAEVRHGVIRPAQFDRLVAFVQEPEGPVRGRLRQK